MPRAPFVPPGFTPPAALQTARMRLRMLSIHDAVKDFDAVMTSAERLRTVFRPGGAWPEGLTLEQNLIELAWHHHEFQRRTSFAYTVVRPDESQALGCLYINPSPREDHNAMVAMWARESEAGSGLDAHLFETVRRWIAREWPFRSPGYPGRTSPWADWA